MSQLTCLGEAAAEPFTLRMTSPMRMPHVSARLPATTCARPPAHTNMTRTSTHEHYISSDAHAFLTVSCAQSPSQMKASYTHSHTRTRTRTRTVPLTLTHSRTSVIVMVAASSTRPKPRCALRGMPAELSEEWRASNPSVRSRFIRAAARRRLSSMDATPVGSLVTGEGCQFPCIALSANQTEEERMHPTKAGTREALHGYSARWDRDYQHARVCRRGRLFRARKSSREYKGHALASAETRWARPLDMREYRRCHCHAAALCVSRRPPHANVPREHRKQRAVLGVESVWAHVGLRHSHDHRRVVPHRIALARFHDLIRRLLHAAPAQPAQAQDYAHSLTLFCQTNGHELTSTLTGWSSQRRRKRRGLPGVKRRQRRSIDGVASSWNSRRPCSSCPRRSARTW